MQPHGGPSQGQHGNSMSGAARGAMWSFNRARYQVSWLTTMRPDCVENGDVGGQVMALRTSDWRKFRDRGRLGQRELHDSVQV